MGVTLDPGSAGASIETNQRVAGQDRQVIELGTLPTYWALTGALTWTASRFQFVLYNNNATAVVRIHLVVMLYPSATAAAGAFSGIWTQRIRTGPTTDPTGTGGLTIFGVDSADTLPSSITAFSTPGTPPAGGTAKDITSFLPQPDEVTLTTLNAQTALTGYDWAGLTLYNYSHLGPNAKPLTLRQDQCYEVQQNATAGVGSAQQILCFFSAI